MDLTLFRLEAAERRRKATVASLLPSKIEVTVTSTVAVLLFA